MAQSDFDAVLRQLRAGVATREVDLERYTHALLAAGEAPPGRRVEVLLQLLGMTREQVRHLGQRTGVSLQEALWAQPVRLAQSAEQATQDTRYTFLRNIGRGSSAQVILVHDAHLGREVAMKVMASRPDDPENLRERFLEEAQATGQLEHPNIIPVYDLGVLESGDLFYTMKFVRKSNFRRIVHRLLKGHPETTRTYGLIKLLTTFNQVCMAVDYAHSKGVIHRDLKPENILLGDYGEVIVMDWGIAKLIGDEIQTSGSIGRRNTPENTVYGTPEYMAPEQAMGFSNTPAVDIYSLGAMLYEILCLAPPFEGRSPVKTMIKVVREQVVPPSQRAEGRHVPELLEDICLRALAKKPQQRQASAKALRDEVEAYIEGHRAEEHNRKMAEARVEAANQVARRYFHFVGRAEDQARTLRAQALQIEGWEELEAKRPLWEANKQHERLQAEAIQALGDAEASYLQALAYEPDNATARQGLARLYWTRLEAAEQTGDHSEALYYKALVARNDTGAFADRLQGDGSLRLTTDMPGVEIHLERLEPVDLRLQVTASWEAGASPLELPRLTMGRYRARVTPPDRPERLLSFRVERSAALELHLPLPQALPGAEDFLFIPPGPALLGDDTLERAALPRQSYELPGFYIARYPVTMAEYLEFINHLEKVDPEAAIAHMPRTRGRGMLCQKSVEGHYEPIERLIVGPARQRYPAGQGYEWFLPVSGVSLSDVHAYLMWRSERDGHAYRLPDEFEWEKAARGGDGRTFPWGDGFDASFCKMGRSRPEPAQPEPVGVFELDVSPYDVRDMAGGISEWTRSLFTASGPTYEERARLDPALTSFERVVRGGAWDSPEIACRAAFRTPMLPDSREPNVGFRLALDVR